ncbi:hypothetical protein BDZ94DRAFT_1262518 [Collybia nuda]|uniref:DUF6534 domain-containing protein n=1 Tax=Collybia nuda TaxID=64659 RepID=A0A9P5Y450_9AGAR|nr:hypothetical protein BDZ94DRAFT_1262518 [Collybia nuda]
MDISKITGPLLIGYLMNCGFQGILCVQTYTYYSAFPRDRSVFKVLVYGVFALETAQTVITIRDAYDTFAVGLRDGNSLDKVRTLWFTFPVIGGLVAFIGQMFFAYRLRILSALWVPTVLVTFFALCSMVAALATGAEVLQAGKLSRLYESTEFITCGLWNGSSAACDFIISAYMFYYLTRRITRSPLAHVRARIARLARLIVETGLLTATMVTLNLLLVLCFKGTSYFAVPSAVVAKLYSNTMLLILNNRITVVGGREDEEISLELDSTIQERPFWKWHLDHRSRRKEQASNSGGSITTMVMESWEDPMHGDHSDVVHIQATAATRVKESHQISLQTKTGVSIIEADKSRLVSSEP